VPGHVKLAWRISVQPDGDEASLVSISFSAGATDVPLSERLLESWSLLGPIAEQQSRRMLAAVEECAEEDEFVSAASFERRSRSRAAA